MGKGKEGKRERRLGREGKVLLPLPPSVYLLPFALFFPLPLFIFPFFAPVTQAHIVLQLRVRLVPLKYHFQDKKIYFTLLDFTYDTD